MVQTSNAITVPRNSTHGEVAIQELVNSSSTPKQLRQRGAPLLNRRELGGKVRELTLEGLQADFPNRFDQVCWSGPSIPLETSPNSLFLQRYIRLQPPSPQNWRWLPKAFATATPVSTWQRVPAYPNKLWYGRLPSLRQLW